MKKNNYIGKYIIKSLSTTFCVIYVKKQYTKHEDDSFIDIKMIFFLIATETVLSTES